MKETITILELWYGGMYEDNLLRQIAAFENKETLERYKLLNPIDQSKYYREVNLQIIKEWN